MNPEAHIADLPLEEHPEAISAALDQLEADLDAVQITPTPGDTGGSPTP